ncbi:PHD finger protein 11 [Ophiophagus hannah]|uniref:PHD finger protein 11 n=1 Tax=Ophiophagus hannah TaxID=8665 RepID=V8NG71_OPHHA|nr:PHD finger protein 11 [Ophiophagus hannah]
MAKMVRRKCALCRNDESCAILYIAEDQNLAVHQDCLLFSSGFVELEEHNTGDLEKRFDVASVVREIKRGKKLFVLRKTHSEIQFLRYVLNENSEKAMPLLVMESSSTPTKMVMNLPFQCLSETFLKLLGGHTSSPPSIVTQAHLTDETVEEENMEVLSEKHDQRKERIEFLKKCKQAGLLNEIFEEMLNSLRLVQEKLMEDNTSEEEYEKTVISLFDCDLFENILRAAHSGTEGKIQELMNTRERLDAQIELFRDLKETVFPASEDTDNTSSGIFE